MGEAEVSPVLDDFSRDIGEGDFFGVLSAEFIDPTSGIDFQDQGVGGGIHGLGQQGNVTEDGAGASAGRRVAARGERGEGIGAESGG